MADRPILFSAPMVRAILAGTKTQTRRVAKPKRSIEPMTDECPYGQPGDRLWVREAHWMDRRDTTLAVMHVDGFVVAKNGRETGQESNPEELGRNHFWKQRPAGLMPRWASRITLEITSVRVERLQKISEADAQAEGIASRRIGTGDARTGCRNVFGLACDDNAWAFSAVQAYGHLWEQINGPGSWDANPWVWVIEFTRAGGSNG